MAKAELDKYYTPDEVIRVCEEKLQKVFKGSISCIIDPCAGDGRWKDSFKRVCQDVVLYDIEPDSEDVSTRDFLKDDLEIPDKPFAIVTNPPFGKANSLSTKFFNKAATMNPDYICFLVPINFGKKNLSRLSREYTCIDEVELPNLHFERIDGVAYSAKESSLRCNFQIWKRQKRTDKICKIVPVIVDGVRVYKREKFTLYRPPCHKIDGKEQPVGVLGKLDGKDLFTIITHGRKAGTVKVFEPDKDKVSVKQFIEPHVEGLYSAIKQEWFNDLRDGFALSYAGSINSQEIINTLEKHLH